MQLLFRISKETAWWHPQLEINHHEKKHLSTSDGTQTDGSANFVGEKFSTFD